MKLYSDASVLRITYEGLTYFQSLMDFYCDSIESLFKDSINNIDAILYDVPNGIAAENTVPGMNLSTISVLRLVVATNDVN